MLDPLYRLPFAQILLLICFGFMISPPQTSQGSGAPVNNIEKDLNLELERLDKAPKYPGEHMPVRLMIRNTSKTTTYQIVMPGDGTMVGWREPHIYYSAKIDNGNGIWKDLVSQPLLRCGLFDDDWQKDIVDIKPEEVVILDEWVLAPDKFFEFLESGTVKMLAHYEFRGLKNPRKGEASGNVEGSIPFSLVSNSVEFDILKPLDIVVRVKGQLKANIPTKLSDIIEVSLINVSDEDVEVLSPTLSAEARLMMHLSADLGWGLQNGIQSNEFGELYTLKPDEEIQILGMGRFANGIDWTWTYPRKETVKLRAEYYSNTHNHRIKSIPDARYLSEWVEIEVIE